MCEIGWEASPPKLSSTQLLPEFSNFISEHLAPLPQKVANLCSTVAQSIYCIPRLSLTLGPFSVLLGTHCWCHAVVNDDGWVFVGSVPFLDQAYGGNTCRSAMANVGCVATEPTSVRLLYKWLCTGKGIVTMWELSVGGSEEDLEQRGNGKNKCDREVCSSQVVRDEMLRSNSKKKRTRRK